MDVKKQKSAKWEVPLRLLALMFLLYIFLICINALGASIKGFGAGAVDDVFKAAANPIVGLLIGMFVTCLLQSSSTTTSLIVGLVATGGLSVPNAVPMIMGANIGTTITNTFVSLGSMTRSEEFKRSFAAANIHDVFNLLTVIIFLPLEVFFGLISKPAIWAAHLLFGAEVNKPDSAIKNHFKHVIHGTEDILTGILGPGLVNWGLLILSVVLLVFALWAIVKTMKGVILSRAEVFFDRIVGKSAFIGIGFGAAVTAMVQSSSVTTSIMVPLAGTGVVNLRTVFPITMGCNLGTTITALLAAMATGKEAALTIALCHVIFNIYGITLLYPIGAIRNRVIALVEWLSDKCTERKSFAFLYVGTVFYLIPGAIIGLQKLLGG